MYGLDTSAVLVWSQCENYELSFLREIKLIYFPLKENPFEIHSAGIKISGQKYKFFIHKTNEYPLNMIWGKY